MKLSDHLEVGPLTLEGRLVMPPMYSGFSDRGAVTEELIDFYVQRAQNDDLGLIITEHSYVSLGGRAKEGQLSMAEDCDLEGLARLVERLHGAKKGLKVFAQINHAGAKATAHSACGSVVGPSDVVLSGDAPRVLTREEIVAIEEDFVAAARRAVQVGYDGVEIHGAHGYLLNQFYSPLTNKREDEYGPDGLENRLRIHLELLAKVRNAVPADFALALRLGACDYVEGGSSYADALVAGKMLEEAGLDLLDLSGGMSGYQVEGLPAVGYFKEISAALKKQGTVPVLLTGGVTTKAQAQGLLDEEAADLIGIGRALYRSARLN